MGSFGGHALPGSFFIVFAVWWTVKIFCRYYKSLTVGGLPFKSSMTFKCSCLCGRLKHWEVEGALKVFFTVVGGTIELITAYKDGKFTHIGNGQHATMFFFFMMSGVIDLLVHHKVPLPKGIEYVIVTLALVVEGFLFMFHLHGRTSLDVMIHTFLLYAIYGNILGFLVEMYFRHNVLAALVRAFFTFLQGTWFWQVGFILYNPSTTAVPWDKEDHEQMMVATMMFTWHMAAIFIFMLLCGAVIGIIYRLQGPFKTDEYDSLTMKLLEPRNNNHIRVDLQDSDISDVEGMDDTNSRLK